MGLTIYYRMKAKVGPDAARDLVRRLHEFVSKLPFDDVSPILEYDPPDGRYVFERATSDGFKPGSRCMERKRADGLVENVEVRALHAICFHANLRGSETASFGLASHPPVVVHREDLVTQLPDNGGEEVRIGAGATVEFNTRQRGWYSWSAFVKTQYAGNPALGGVENFLRAHHAVFDAADQCKRLGMTPHPRRRQILASPRRPEADRRAETVGRNHRRLCRKAQRRARQHPRLPRRPHQGPSRFRAPGGTRRGATGEGREHQTSE